ncbi:hypothetical protein BD309DRAFT_1073197, partial [Dichomitus squalens]
MNHTPTILPRMLMTGSTGYMTEADLTGSAVPPFVAGLVASRFVTTPFHAFVVSMMSTLIVPWVL